MAGGLSLQVNTEHEYGWGGVWVCSRQCMSCPLTMDLAFQHSRKTAIVPAWSVPGLRLTRMTPTTNHHPCDATPPRTCRSGCARGSLGTCCTLSRLALYLQHRDRLTYPRPRKVHHGASDVPGVYSTGGLLADCGLPLRRTNYPIHPSAYPRPCDRGEGHSRFLHAHCVLHAFAFNLDHSLSTRYRDRCADGRLLSTFQR